MVVVVLKVAIPGIVEGLAIASEVYIVLPPEPEDSVLLSSSSVLQLSNGGVGVEVMGHNAVYPIHRTSLGYVGTSVLAYLLPSHWRHPLLNPRSSRFPYMPALSEYYYGILPPIIIRNSRNRFPPIIMVDQG